MQATDLRIGNYVQSFTSTGDYVTVLGISKKDSGSDGLLYYMEHEKGHTLISDSEGDELVSGIPITEEWLVKLGFEYIKQYGVYSKNGISFGYRTDAEGLFLTDFFDDWKIVPIYYVHQLQNLYFALTGNELTIS